MKIWESVSQDITNLTNFKNQLKPIYDDKTITGGQHSISSLLSSWSTDGDNGLATFTHAASGSSVCADAPKNTGEFLYLVLGSERRRQVLAFPYSGGKSGQNMFLRQWFNGSWIDTSWLQPFFGIERTLTISNKNAGVTMHTYKAYQMGSLVQLNFQFSCNSSVTGSQGLFKFSGVSLPNSTLWTTASNGKHSGSLEIHSDGSVYTAGDSWEPASWMSCTIIYMASSF